MKLALIIFGAIVLYGIVVTVVNRGAVLSARTVDFSSASRAKMRMPDTVSVGTWNLGYAGLGRESDFAVDGGENLFPPSRAIVDKNIEQITEVAGQLATNVQFFQEVSYSGPLSLWKSVATPLENTAGSNVFWWRPDISSQLLPWPIRLKHGTVITTDLKATTGELFPIVGEPEPLFGFLNRQYGMQVLKMPGATESIEWAFINIHLSAFDDGGDLRRQQIDSVFSYAKSLYEAGFHVVIGGDWNMELAETAFPHQTSDEDLFWIHRFPQESIPEGWKLAIDTSLPTVRTVNQAFVRGENYLTIIDGFVVSPNVEVVSVSTTDTDFEMSDHMPVIGNFRAVQ